MKMKKIVFLPLDERPCNYGFPAFLSEENPAYRLVRPSLDLLGRKKQAADCDALASFLREECKDADYLVASVDMLLYGGIVPSRLHHLDEQTLRGRLDLLDELKANSPALKIYAFSLIMRCPSYSSADEEPDYYDVCGREIFLRGQAEHKYAEGVISEGEYLAEVARTREKIGNNLSDYLFRRERNLTMVLEALKKVGGTIDKFIIPQDDSNPYGYTAIDQGKVKAFIAANAVPEVDMYPGADEVGLTLLSAVVTDIEEYQPKICPVYPNEACKKVIPLYEDREVEKSIACQIRNAGGVLTESEEEADILLFCNLPVGKMKNVTEAGDEGYAARNLEAYTDKMAAAQKQGKAVAAADIAYCNGGDMEWVKLISEKAGIFNLAGYAGWNTSSNTLGTVVCQSVLHRFYGNTATHGRFLAERIFEDVGYCAHTRKYVCDNLLPGMGLDYFHADGRKGEVSKLVKAEIERYVGANFPEVTEKYEIDDCEMPWSRMFEVGLHVAEKK